MQAHNAGIKAMRWTPDESVMVSGDQLGFIKLWVGGLQHQQHVIPFNRVAL